MFEDFYREFLMSSESLPEEFRKEETAEKLYLHISELSDKGRLFNLTAITDMTEAVNKHVVDSLFAAKAARELSGGRDADLIDIGSGGGFPAIPIAIFCPNFKVAALDSTAKKCEFISEIAKKCGIDVETIAERAEEAVYSRRETFDFVTARAVARLNVLSELCAPFVKVGGYFIAMKGSAAEEERLEAATGAEKLGLRYEKSIPYEIEGGGERRILIYKKVSPTPPEYPRRYAKIKKNPL